QRVGRGLGVVVGGARPGRAAAVLPFDRATARAHRAAVEQAEVVVGVDHDGAHAGRAARHGYPSFGRAVRPGRALVPRPVQPYLVAGFAIREHRPGHPGRRIDVQGNLPAVESGRGEGLAVAGGVRGVAAVAELAAHRTVRPRGARDAVGIAAGAQQAAAVTGRVVEVV